MVDVVLYPWWERIKGLSKPKKISLACLSLNAVVLCLLIWFCLAQVKTFKPQLVAVRNESLVDELKEALADLDEKPEIIPGEQGVIEVFFPV